MDPQNRLYILIPRITTLLQMGKRYPYGTATPEYLSCGTWSNGKLSRRLGTLYKGAKRMTANTDDRSQIHIKKGDQ